MAKYKFIIILIVVLVSKISYAQKENIKFKTTDTYKIEMPTSGDYYHKDLLCEWEINLYSKWISYKKDGQKTFFFYNTDELIKNEDGEIVMNLENSTESIYFSSYYNYLKISHYTKLDNSSSEKAYKNIEVYTNYEINDIIKIMDHNIH
jgi:hypothetical protein